MDGLTRQNKRFKLAGNQEIIYCMLYKSILSIKQSNGRNCTGEFHFFAIIFSILLHDTFDHSAAPFGRVARQLDSLLLITRYDLSSRFSNKEPPR